VKKETALSLERVMTSSQGTLWHNSHFYFLPKCTLSRALLPLKRVHHLPTFQLKATQLVTEFLEERPSFVRPDVRQSKQSRKQG
jgi:hypothetical protein